MVITNTNTDAVSTLGSLQN